MSNRAVICKISELQPFDRILSGTVLGPITAAETLTIKSVSPADNKKYAVTFSNLGTVFLHEATLVEIIPAYNDEDDDYDDD